MIYFAIIGMGNIGIRHARHIAQHPETALLAVCDIQSKRLTVLSEQYPYAKQFADYHQLLQIPALDVVNVCTPNYLHADMSVAALEAGKHVVCEKPMALSTAECERMIDAAAANERKLFVVKQNRYNPPVVAVKQLLDTGVLGKVYQINVNCFWNRNDDYYLHSEWHGRKALDGGCLFTQCSHFVDVMYYLIGKVNCVGGIIKNAGHGSAIEFEDTGSFVLESLSGAIIGFNFSTCAFAHNMEGSITIIAQNGTVKIGGQYLNTIEYQQINNKIHIDLPPQAGNSFNDYGTYRGSMSNHDKIIQNVVDTLQNRADIATSGEEGKCVVEIIENMYQVAQKTKI